MQSDGLNYTADRKYAAKLFIAVLTKRIPVREALLHFPKSCEDTTLIAAWHALCHLEADEDIRRADSEYAREQDDYIEFISNTLNNGDALPENIIASYIPYHDSILNGEKSDIKGVFRKLMKFIST